MVDQGGDLVLLEDNEVCFLFFCFFMAFSLFPHVSSIFVVCITLWSTFGFAFCPLFVGDVQENHEKLIYVNLVRGWCCFELAHQG